MSDVGTVYVDVRPDTSGFGRDLSRDITRQRSGFARMGRNIGLGLAGGVAAGIAAAGVGVAKFLKYSVEEAAEAQKIAAQTTAVIKSTGGAANVTAKEVDKLATSLARKTGVDDEAIAASQNLLLTFTKIRNETGKGNAIFDRAAEAVLDVSTAMKIDLNSASKMVGKALNDPVLGVTALTRAGVQFTKAQKNQIKAMVEAGDVANAQKLILKELEKQTGGSAKAAGDTFAGSMDKLKVAFGDLAERVGNKLTPYLRKFADWIVKNMPQIEAAVMTAFKTIVRFTRDSLIPALQDMGNWFKRNRETINNWSAALQGEFRQTEGAVESHEDTARRWYVNVDKWFRENSNASNRWGRNVRAVFAGIIDKMYDANQAMRDFGSDVIKWMGGVEDYFRGVPARIGEALSGVGKAVRDAFTFDLPTLRMPWGDGPGASAGGKALDRVRSMLPAGAYITSTYRTPAQNAAAGGSPTSYHMDRSNPAVDIGGPTHVLDALYARMAAAGGWRELLWRVAGHYDHIHAADEGGVFKGPGFVKMGAGYETFASGLRAKKVADVPSAAPVINLTVNASGMYPEDVADAVLSALGEAQMAGAPA